MMRSGENSDQEHRYKVRKTFLERHQTPQDRLDFLKDHVRKFRHAMVRLRDAVKLGWKSRSNHAEYRSQKDRVRSIFQDIANEARELDKLHIFDFIEVDKMAGPNSIIAMDGKMRHIDFEKVDDDLLQQAVNWLLEEPQWSRLAGMTIYENVSSIAQKMQDTDAQVKFGPIPLVDGDAIPIATSMAGIDEQGVPYVIILERPETGRVALRSSTSGELGKTVPEILTSELPGMAWECQILMRSFDDESEPSQIVATPEWGTFKWESVDLPNGFYIIKMRVYGRGDIVVLGKGRTTAYIGNTRSFDGTLRKDIGADILQSDPISRLIKSKAEALAEPEDIREYGCHPVINEGVILFLADKQCRAEVKIIPNDQGTIELQYRVENIK